MKKQHRHGLSETELKEFAQDPDFVAEGIALRVIEQMLELMEKKGIAKADLARLMNVSPGYVSQILSAPPNLTLRSLVQLALAVGAQVDVKLNAPERGKVASAPSGRSSSTAT